MPQRDKESRATASGPRRTAHLLRDRLGGAPREAVQRHQQENRARRQILAALEQGPATVPEIAQTSGLPAHQVLWHVMAMKKYGQIVEGPQSGDYYEYGLKEHGELET